MSKNFEVLLRAERDAELFGTAAIATGVVEPKPERIRPHVHIDASVHKEELKLIERVFLLPGQHAPRTVVFCGIEASGGSVGICARAGRNLADQTGMSVCLVDADLSSPSSLHDYFDVENQLVRGANANSSQSESILELAHRIGGGHLFLVSLDQLVGGTATTWKCEAWPAKLNELRRAFCYVLIAAPPVASHTDTVFLGRSADGVILVLESQSTRRETARAVKQSLAEADVQLLGAVLNNHTHPIPDSLYKML